MRVLTNFERFPKQWATGDCSGEAAIARTFAEFRRGLGSADLLLINCGPGLLLQLCALFLVRPSLRKPLVAVDLVLRAPQSLQSRISTGFKRLLLKQVSLYVHYFRDLSGYEHYFGISPEKSRYVPFKPNIRYKFDTPPSAHGEYILCLGRSMRDFPTFIAAIGALPFPTVIPKPDPAQHGIHGSHYSILSEKLPPNVTLLEDDGSEQAMVNMVSSARLVVLPILKTSLCASGISTYLNAMLLGKCVVLSDGPGGSDVLTDQALICPSGDPPALAALIQRAWEDDELRERTAQAGYRYALSLGGEPELRQRILDVVIPQFKDARS